MIKSPRRDLIEVLPMQFMPEQRRKRGQFFRVWINGVEATSVKAVDGEWDAVSVSATKITDPPGAGVKHAYKATIEFASPRIRQIKRPPRKASK